MTESSEPTDIRDRDVVDYDQVGVDDDYPPFPLKIGGEYLQVAYPLASTKRAIQTAITENRASDVYAMAFGEHWPFISEALDALGPRGDDAQTHLMLDWMDHVGMNQEAVERYRANRAERRQQRAARHVRGRRGR